MCSGSPARRAEGHLTLILLTIRQGLLLALTEAWSPIYRRSFGSMASAALLWEALRQRGISESAPAFVAAGAPAAWSSWMAAGDASIRRPGASSYGEGRSDLPPIKKRRRASLNEALQAAQADTRASALAELDRDVLAHTTSGRPEASRLAVWHRLCQAWGVPPFPLDAENVRAVGACLKKGQYRSAAQYNSAAASGPAVRALHHLGLCQVHSQGTWDSQTSGG